MRDFRRQPAVTCIVRLRLPRNKTLEIFTSAARAMEILGGTTVIPTRLVSVFDREGRQLTPSELADLPD